MLTELQAIVFDAGEPWLAARTLRALSRRGVEASVSAAAELPDRLASARGPVWLLRAGAWPLESPTPVLSRSPGRPVLALGATASSLAWRNVLADTGGDLERARTLPRVDSAVLLEPKAFSAIDLTRDPSRAAVHARVVRIPSLDVEFHRSLRLVLAVPTLHRGGAERIVVDLARQLRIAGHDVLLAVIDRATRSTFEEDAGALHLRHLPRRERVAHLASLAEAHGADVIHAHLLDGHELAELCEGSIPVAVTVHNARDGWPTDFATKLAFVEHPPLLVACSRGVAKDLQLAGLGKRTRTIWNGIAHTRTTSSDAARLAARRALAIGPEIPPEALLLLAVANHRPQKRLYRLPTVVAALRVRGIDARLVILGEPVRGDDAAIAASVAAESRRLGVEAWVTVASSSADVSLAYAAADVLVGTSAFEGLSLVQLEALAAGLPVVTTAVHGADELARKHDRVRIVPAGASPDDFADAVLASTRGTTALSPEFSTPRMTDRYIDMFARISVPDVAAARRGLVLVTNNFSTGGAQSSARRLLIELAASGIPVQAIVIEEQEAFPTPGREALVAVGIAVHAAPRAGAVDALVTARAVVARIDAVRPQAVLFWNVIPEHKVLVADLLLDVPVWDVSPGEMYYASFERFFSKPRPNLPYLDLRDYGRVLAGAVVKYVGEEARAAGALGIRVDVVANGVPVPSAPGRRARQARVVAGTMARLSPDKKLDQLIDAVASSKHSGLLPDDFELRIAGAPERGLEAYARELEERSAGLPIAWVGEQASEAFLQELDLFVMVSEPSGCPNASLEAMAAGLAVVATDVGGAREQVVDAVTGRLVPRGDTRALGEALAALARDPGRREAYGDAGHRRARERFGVARMAGDYARILGLR